LSPLVPQRNYVPWLLFVGWGAAIAWLSLTPSPPLLHQPLLGWDKFQHASAYAILTLAGGRAMGGTGRAFGGAFFIALIYGGSIELAQGYCTKNRAADWFDLVANMTGAGAVASIAIIISTIRRKGLP